MYNEKDNKKIQKNNKINEKRKVKKFSKDMEKQLKKSVKEIKNNPEKAKEILKNYEIFLDKNYTNNSTKLTSYLYRYRYLGYRDGYTKTILLGILGGMMVVLGQEYLFPFAESITNSNILSIISNLKFLLGVIAALVYILLLLLVVLIISVLGIFVYKMFDMIFYRSGYSENYYEILLKIEMNYLKNCLNEGLKISV